MSKAVFLDRDGTINKEVPNLSSTSQIEIPKNSIEALKMLQEAGFKLIVITNQSAVARGFLTEEKLQKIHQYFDTLFSAHNITIHDYFYCPHHAEENCHCRKPKTQLVEEAIQKHNINPSQSFFIGDKMSDIECGLNAGMKSILVLTGYGKSFKKQAQNLASYIAKDLFDATSWIINT